MNAKQRYELFTAKYVVNPENGCWDWTGYISPDGYASFSYPHRGEISHNAKRYAYRYYKGTIPRKFHIDHLCRNKACVNPEHLEAVTCQVNNLRGVGIAANNARKTHCIEGHKLSGKNLYLEKLKTGRISRQCRICKYRRSKTWIIKRSRQEFVELINKVKEEL